MVEYRNECVSCGLPCMRRACVYWNVPHYYCDWCGTELGEVYSIDEFDLCLECYEKAEYERELEEYELEECA